MTAICHHWESRLKRCWWRKSLCTSYTWFGRMYLSDVLVPNESVSLTFESVRKSKQKLMTITFSWCKEREIWSIQWSANLAHWSYAFNSEAFSYQLMDSHFTERLALDLWSLFVPHPSCLWCTGTHHSHTSVLQTGSSTSCLDSDVWSWCSPLKGVCVY